MLSSCNSLSSMLYLLFLICPFASAQDAIKLVFPPKNGNGDRTFVSGDAVPLQWTCTFPMFTLQLWQGPDNDGTKAFSNLLTNVTDTSVRSLQWSATTIAGFTNDVPMHIRVFNSEDNDCDTCNVVSDDFHITDGTKTNSTDGSSTAVPSTTQTAAEGSSNLGVALGVGLGVGIPLAAVITGIVTFCCLRRRWRDPEIRTADPYEAPLTAWKQSAPVSQDFDPGYYAGDVQKPPRRVLHAPEAAELQPELMRVEAPRDAERIELDANASQSNLARKYSW